MNDITEGEYEVYVDAGPAYNTLRIEAVNSLMEMAQAYPEILTIAGDVLAINMDWPGARALAERLRRFINQRTPGILSPHSHFTTHDKNFKSRHSRMVTIRGRVEHHRSPSKVSSIDTTNTHCP
jgi:hypothetical protein